MATYYSLEKKIQDAVAISLPVIGSDVDAIAGLTIYKGAGNAEILPPCIVVICTKAEIFTEANTLALPDHYLATVEIHAVTNFEDTTYDAHHALAGGLQAIFHRSIDQVASSINAAAVSQFYAQRWQPTDIEFTTDEGLRISVIRGILHCINNATS